MPATYEPIATTTLGSNSESITFSSISSSYTDLKLILVGKVTAAGNVNLQFNSDTGTNYSYTNLRGNGTTAASGRGTDATLLLTQWSAPAADSFILAECDLFSYSGSTNKTVLISGSNDRNGAGEKSLYVGLWRSTSAINSIKIFHGNPAGLGSGFTATLYGILKA